MSYYPLDDTDTFLIVLTLGIIGILFFGLFLYTTNKHTKKEPVVVIEECSSRLIKSGNHEYLHIVGYQGVLHNPDCEFCLSNKLEEVVR